MARRYYSSTAARTTLAADITASATTMVVAAVSGWPASYPYTLIVDQDTVSEEVVTVTNRSGTTLTVVRGEDGTSGVSHSAGASVNHGVSARDFDEANAYINAEHASTFYQSSQPMTPPNGALWVDSDGSGSIIDVNDYALKTYVDSGLAAKANLASPTFTGVPAAPTAAAGTNTTQLATTAFVLANGGALINAGATTFTTSSAVILNNIFSPTYRAYRIFLIINGASTADTLISARLRASGTDNSSSYHTEEVQQYGTTVNGSSNPGIDGTKWRFGNAGNTYPASCGFTVDLISPAVAVPTLMYGKGYWRNAGGTWVNVSYSGDHGVSAAYDGIDLLSSSGTISGEVFVWGYKA